MADDSYYDYNAQQTTGGGGYSTLHHYTTQFASGSPPPPSGMPMYNPYQQPQQQQAQNRFELRQQKQMPHLFNHLGSQPQQPAILGPHQQKQIEGAQRSRGESAQHHHARYAVC